MEHAADSRLADEWVWWAHVANDTSYSKAYLMLGEFNTICGFWSHFNHIPLPHQAFTHEKRLFINKEEVSSFSVFKKGVKPEWEHEINKNGTEWSFRDHVDEMRVSDVWKDLLIDAMCNKFDDVVVGFRFVLKAGRRNIYKIEVWMCSCSSQEQQAVRDHLTRLCGDFTFSLIDHGARVENAGRKPTSRVRRRHYSHSSAHDAFCDREDSTNAD
jgi:hypothetical protein